MYLFQNIAEKCNGSTCMCISTRVHVCVGVSSAEKQGFPQCRVAQEWSDPSFPSCHNEISAVTLQL